MDTMGFNPIITKTPEEEEQEERQRLATTLEFTVQHSNSFGGGYPMSPIEIFFFVSRNSVLVLWIWQKILRVLQLQAHYLTVLVLILLIAHLLLWPFRRKGTLPSLSHTSFPFANQLIRFLLKANKKI